MSNVAPNRGPFYTVAPCGLVYGPPASLEHAQAVIALHRLAPDEEGWEIVAANELAAALARIDAEMDARYRKRMAAYGVEVH